MWEWIKRNLGWILLAVLTVLAYIAGGARNVKLLVVFSIFAVLMQGALSRLSDWVADWTGTQPFDAE